MKKALPWLIGLNPLSVENELRDGALAGVCDDLGCCAGGGFDVDFFIRNCVLIEKALGLAAIAAPVG